MSTKPILFNTDMVRAILDGRKTATRRTIKNLDIEENRGMITLYEKNEDDAFCVSQIKYAQKEMLSYSIYQPGDILYVRETWRCRRAHRYEATADIDFRAGGKDIRIQFENGNTDSICRNDYDEFVRKWYSYNGKWLPSIHMPKEVARIWLMVTDVRVERLQDMTLDDFLADGVVLRPEAFNDPANAYLQARDIFRNIWDSTIPKAKLSQNGWDASPWVWVIEFERCEKPECLA